MIQGVPSVNQGKGMDVPQVGAGGSDANRLLTWYIIILLIVF